MHSIQNRLDLLQSKLSILVQKMEEQKHIYKTIQSENNRLKTSLREKEEEINQWKSKVDSAIDSTQIEENQQMIKAKIEGFVEEIDECIALKSHVSDMDDAQIKISVVIAGRSFPVKITEEEETSVRSIEKDINSQVTEFQQKYTDKDKLDLVIMVLLTKAFELDKIQSLENDITQAHAQIDTLESTLDQLM